MDAAEFWNKWTCLDKTVDLTVVFKHGDNPPSNDCVVNVTHDDQTVCLRMSPDLVQSGNVSEYPDDLGLHSLLTLVILSIMFVTFN